MNIPPPPSGSLYGAFPSFPSYQMTILTYSFSVPNVAEVPLWVLEIIAWAIGWPLAYFQWMIEAAAIVVSAPIVWLVNEFGSLFTWLLDEITSIASRTGPFEPIVSALLFGALLMALILGVRAVVKFAGELVGGLVS